MTDSELSSIAPDEATTADDVTSGFVASPPTQDKLLIIWHATSNGLFDVFVGPNVVFKDISPAATNDHVPFAAKAVNAEVDLLQFFSCAFADPGCPNSRPQRLHE